ncbi:hypothetical protein Psfp_01009 [Pelotomaculum sp. FP]|uniref:Flp family type IVb pilin n=1 Tax=Pelotomaculum sp. FP TaxID=261474 RepID=UPI001065F95D|nr:Flp family type IVb pilin [Pelotomaculum sp. FP]TEB16842.1 hypothetical protein Psfp_01009 [Pelotomaculum sp. FP]
MKSLVRKFSKEEAGQGLAEYAFILMLVAMVAIAALKTMSSGIINAFSDTTENFN